MVTLPSTLWNKCNTVSYSLEKHVTRNMFRKLRKFIWERGSREWSGEVWTINLVSEQCTIQQPLVKANALREMLSKAGGKRIPNILHICYTILHSDHKTKWQDSQYSWLFVCFSTQYTTISFLFFSTREEKCLCTISPYYFKPSKYRVIYFILNKFVSFKLQ